MKTLSDRFRFWYAHERDCNAKSLAMLASVPADRRAAPEFEKAVGRMAHLIAARQRWAQRLGLRTEGPAGPFPTITRDELPALVAEIEAVWTAYLERLDDAGLAREFEWALDDGRRFRWNIEGLLTQLNGHAWYHRGQIAQLVAQLGGTAVDTDYIFFCRPAPL